MSILVSLVMTTYNRERYVGAAIASVLAQTYPHFELMVWDDGSTDDTVAIARQYADRDRRVKVVAAPHRGRVASLNAAMAQTHGPYLGLVDSDDLLAPTALADTVAVLNAQPSVGWLYTDHQLIDSDGDSLGYDPRHIPYSPLGLLVDFMTFHFRLMRRSLFDQVGGFTDSPDYVEDYDLCLKLSEVSPPYHLQKALYFYRHHGGNISRLQADLQLQRAQQVVERAIQRRGLADQLQLTVENRRFILRGRLKQPAPMSWRACLSPPIARPVGTVLASLSLSGLAIGEAQALVAPSPGQLRQATVTNPVGDSAESILPAAQPTAPDQPQGQPRFAAIPPLSVQLAQAIQPASDGTGTVVNQTGNQFEITGGQRSLDQTNLFHSFEQFNLTAEQAATFLSQPEIQNIVGRVVGGDPSLLNGLLQVLGGPSNLYLVNPAGLLVGPNIQLDIPGSLTLTSANALSFGDQWLPTTGPVDYSLLNGAPTGFTFLADSPSPVVNTGNLSVNPGAAVRLMGGAVVNTGTITAPGGEITLAAVPGSSTVRISQPGQLLSLEVEAAALQSLATGGTLPVTSLPALLTGGLPTPGLTVNGMGQAVLTTTNTVIPAGQVAIASGQLNTANPNGVGGTVAVLGDRVGLFNATLDASGQTGGGQILVGGGYQGQGPVPNASRTFVNDGTTLAANALTMGNGGQAIVWADGATTFLGNIQLRGGTVAGDGGFAEVSGLEFLDYRGQVDASAPNGAIGTLLLDPTNIEVVEADFDPDDLEDVNDFSDPDQDPANQRTLLSVGAINSASADVELQATNNITFNADVDLTGSGYGLSVTAGNRIDINNSIRLGGSDFVANSAVFDASGITISTQGGDISITTTGGDLAAGNLDTSIILEGSGYGTTSAASGGDIFLSSAGNLFTESINSRSEVSNTGDSVTANAGAGGDVTLLANGTALVSGNIQTDSVAVATDNDDNLLLTAIANADQAGDVIILARGGMTVSGSIDATSRATAIDQFGGVATATAGPGGNVTLRSTNGAANVSVGNVNNFSQAQAQSSVATNATAISDRGGITAITANGNLQVGSVNTQSDSSAGGSVALSSQTGTVTAGDLTTTGLTQGGNVAVSASQSITAGRINTSSSLGDGGNVLLDPIGDIQVTFIDAQGGVEGTGGTVDITTDRFFRATGTFVDQNSISASISTAGGAGGGPITLRHGGGLQATPFTVGPVYTGLNGTAGAITTGQDNTISGGSFPATYQQGDNPSIQIVTQQPPPPPPPTRPGEELQIETQGEPPPGLPPTEFLPPQTQAQIKDLNEARDILRQVENATGIKPALVYVQFIPTRLAVEPDSRATAASEVEPPEVETIRADPGTNFVQSETAYTQRFESYLALPNTPTQAPISPQADTDQLELMVITADGPPIWKRVDVNRDEVLATAQRLRLEVADPRKVWTNSYRPSAEQLYQWVIDPIQAELQTRGIGNLTFLADAGLRSLPWAALYNAGTNRFLIETYSVGLMPSLSLADTRFVDVRNAQMLAAGASTFATQAPLPAVPQELALLKTIWNAQVLEEDQFTAETLRQRRQQTPYGIVHLATHGEFQPGSPERSFIQLKDEQLQLDQLRQMGWSNPPLELLVLSACRTALGDTEAELGFAGLAIQAGVKSALASLWYVSDVGSLALMTEFYRQLHEAPRATLKAEALRQAQLELLRGEVAIADGTLQLPGQTAGIPLGPELSGTQVSSLQHPYFWAAYTLSGNPW